LASEWVALAAALATLQIMVEQRVPAYLARVGGRLLAGLRRLAGQHAKIVAGVGGVPEMCFLQFRDEAMSGRFAQTAAGHGLLFKRSAYNFVSLAHDEATIDRSLSV